jgi:aerobic-type carbon monoxide dehydrogenase small subunit (CoxS/CutS family)
MASGVLLFCIYCKPAMIICKRKMLELEAKDFVQSICGTFKDPWNYLLGLCSLSRRMAENTHRRKWKT